MLEKGLSVVAAIGIPLIGLLLRASRRNRLRERMNDYLAIADRVADHDLDAARDFRRLASEAARVLISREERWLHRKIDGAAVAAVIFLVVPSITGFVLAWNWDSAWRWPTLIFTGLWTLVWGGAGLTQLWKERGDEA